MSDRRERKRIQTRKALLEAAMSLFTERGIHATRLEDITERADLGKGAFYNYFDSKDALVAELVGEGLDRLEREYLAGLDVNVPQRIAPVVAAHYAFFRDRPEYVMLFHQARGILKVRTDGAATLQRVFRRYLEVLGRVVLPAGGEHVDEAARVDVAAVVAGAVSGYLSFCLAAGLEPHAATVERTLADGALAARKRGPGEVG